MGTLRLRHLLSYTAMLSGASVLVLAVLWLAGFLAFAPAAAGMLAVCAVMLGLVWFWLADLGRLASQAAPTRLAALDAAARTIDRLTRNVDEHGTLVGRMVKVDAAIVENLPDPLIVLDANHTALRANRAARALFGADSAALLRYPALRATLQSASETGEAQTGALHLPVPVERDLLIAAIPMDPPLADGGRMVLVLSDRTHERALNRMRTDFIANASHELRTPLTSLTGFIDTLRGPAADDPAAQQRFLGIMADQAARMRRLIDDLLALSHIELLERRPPQDTVDLGALLYRALDGFELRTAARRITRDFTIAPDLPPITGDADQLMQVLNNLIDNAIKYNRDGGTLRVTLERAGTAGHWPAQPGLLLQITDSGDGIPPEHLPRLTERFYRVDAARSRSIGGTGLGLAIVKHVINRHRGRMLIESSEGVGTCVSVWLATAGQDGTDRGPVPG